jgi:hypothetical protein
METGEEIDVASLRRAVALGAIQWHLHALSRALERGISRGETIRAILEGEVIEVYVHDRPFPSCLILHASPKPLHVVAAVDSGACVAHIITVYRPDAERFESDWKTRRKQP